jgi:tRNA threonylcarbamoyl adenosine modification protein YeaZ
MTILALEFSAAQRSVALAREGVVLAETMEAGGYRVTNAFGLIEKVLAQAGASREAIGAIAVGLGPGSYTGIRAAIAVAQGWQLARGVKLLGVSSVACLAEQAREQGVLERFNVVIDAQRNEFYLAQFEASAASLTEISPLRIVPAEDVAARKAAGEVCLGPEMDRVMFPMAATIARLAAARKDFISGDKLEPIYLRETSFVKAPTPRITA